MKIDHRTSLKIEALRFPLIVGVVFIHMGTNYSNLIVGNPDSSLFIYRFIIHLISNVISSSAVPLFFFISALLFFTGYQPTCESYFGKLKTRFQSLFIPYIFWNVSYLLFKLLIQVSPLLSATIGGTSKRVMEYQFFDYFDALSGLTSFPISYQFWFIRDLMIMVCLAPIIWLATNYFSWLPAMFFIIIWIVDPGLIANIHNESWLFFSLGCLVAQGKLDVNISQHYKYVLLFVYVILACATAGLYVVSFDFPVFGKLVTLLGVAAIWYSSDLIIKKGKIENFFIAMSAYSFFIFAAHEPLLGIEVKIISKLSLLQGYTTAFAMYFIVPIVTIALLWFLGSVLKLKAPRLYEIITGGRRNNKG
ncbi:MAG: acyltransferase family protein [Methylotenera sp.]